MRTRKSYKEPLYVLLAFITSIAIVLAVVISIQVSELTRYKDISGMPNQACRGISIAVKHGINLAAIDSSINASSSIYKSDDFNRIANFHCGISVITQAATIQGKPIQGYEMGADVTYFKDSDSAKKYADKKINPLRYWGVDTQGQKGIPQTSLFTFLVSDNGIFGKPKLPIFDAYSVTENALVRISMPCTYAAKNPTQAQIKCTEPMGAILKEFRSIVPDLKFD